MEKRECFLSPLKMQRTWAVQIIKGITRNNFVKFIFASSSKDSARPPCAVLPHCLRVCETAAVSVSPIGKTETNLVSLPFPFRKLSNQTGRREDVRGLGGVVVVCGTFQIPGHMLFTCQPRFILYCRSALELGFCRIKANKGRAFCLHPTGNCR